MKFLRLIFVPLLLLLGACDSTTAPDPNAHVGAYSLITVNGNPVPAFMGTENGFTLTALSGTLSLNLDQTASLSIRVRATQGTGSVEDTLSIPGTYTRNGNSIFVQWANGSQDTMGFDEEDDELTLTDEGVVLLFRK